MSHIANCDINSSRLLLDEHNFTTIINITINDKITKNVVMFNVFLKDRFTYVQFLLKYYRITPFVMFIASH